MYMKEQLDVYKTNVDRRLLIRQTIFFIIIAILMVISIRNIVTGKIDDLLAASGFLLATFIGLILSRMFRIFWHEEKERVVSQLDTLGTILLVIYISVELGRKWLFEHWLSGAQLNAFGLIILTGLLLGRFLGTSLQIKQVLSENV
jgi:hypothetical protein